jgi:hypothetical protein
MLGEADGAWADRGSRLTAAAHGLAQRASAPSLISLRNSLLITPGPEKKISQA